MPGLDYMGPEYVDPAAGNLFNSFGLVAAGEIGYQITSWGTRKYASKIPFEWNTAYEIGGFQPTGRNTITGRFQSRRPLTYNEATGRLAAQSGKFVSMGGHASVNPERIFHRKQYSPENLQKKIQLRQIARGAKALGRLAGMVGMAQLGMELVGGVAGAVSGYQTTEDELERMRHTSLYKENAYHDTRAAFTQRQRALQVIHNSRLNLKPALGSESSYVHM